MSVDFLITTSPPENNALGINFFPDTTGEPYAEQSGTSVPQVPEQIGTIVKQDPEQSEHTRHDSTPG